MLALVFLVGLILVCSSLHSLRKLREQKEEQEQEPGLTINIYFNGEPVEEEDVVDLHPDEYRTLH